MTDEAQTPPTPEELAQMQEKLKAEHRDSIQMGGLYQPATCRLCGRVWQRDQGKAPDPACNHTDQEWADWAAVNVPPGEPITRWTIPITPPPPVELP